MHRPGDVIHFYTAIASPPTDYVHFTLPIMINIVHRLSTDEIFTFNIEAQQSVFFRLNIGNWETDYVITATTNSSIVHRKRHLMDITFPLQIFADLNHKLPSSLSWTHSYRASTTSSNVTQLIIPKEDLKEKRFVYIGRNLGFIAPHDRQRFFFTTPFPKPSADSKLIVSLESAAPLKCFVSRHDQNIDPTEQKHDWLITPGNTLLVDVDFYQRELTQLTWWFSLVHTATVNANPDPFEVYVALVTPLVSGMHQFEN
ncbi:hypothetical protein GEMRC1_000805 [Eukaryota sp. GEM-RC1]